MYDVCMLHMPMTVTGREDDGPDAYECDDCGEVSPLDALGDVPAAQLRESRWADRPAGQCPYCHGLCYPMHP